LSDLRNILVFTTEFPPTPIVGALRLGKLCTYLPRYGWQPSVVTVAHSAHTPTRDPLSDQPLRPLTYQGERLIEVVAPWAPNPLVIGSRMRRRVWPLRGDGNASAPTDDLFKPPHRRVAWELTKRMVPDEYALWVLPAVFRGLQIARKKRIDCVWASFPWASGVAAAAFVSKRIGAPLLVDFRDSWASWHPVVEAPVWRQRIEEAIERRVFRAARAATAVNAAMARDIRSRHPGFTGVVETLPQGWDPVEASSLEELRPASESDGVLRICYGGIVRPDVSNPTSFFDALALLKKQEVINPARIKVTFFGNQLMDLRGLARTKGIDDIVRVGPHRDRREALVEFARADTLLMIGIKKDPDWLTGKVWDYLSARRLIMAIGHRYTAAAEVLSTTGTGWVARPDDVPEIAEMLARLWKSFEADGCVPYEPNADELNRYSIAQIASRAAHLLDSLVGSGSSP